MTYYEELTNTRYKKPENMAAGIQSMVLHIRKENIKQCLSDMDYVGHRQDYVDTIDGVMYYDDSKAESVNATWFTFENIIKPVVWIAGGDDKNCDFTELKPLAKRSVRALICVGKNNKNLKSSFKESITEIYSATDIDEAVKMASALAQEDDIVLYSPACKSSSQKESFVERGEAFVASVNQLKK